MTTIGEALGNRPTTRVRLRVESSHVLMNEPQPPVFLHCWECMLGVTPSGRALMVWMRFPSGEQATIVPMSPEGMTIQCMARRGSFRLP